MTALPIGAWPSLWRCAGRFAPGHTRAAAADGVRHPFAPWVVLLAAVVAWELVQYLTAGSRAQHPTLSSMADAVDRYTALKAVVFFLWLCLGAAIVRSGARARGGGQRARRRR